MNRYLLSALFSATLLNISCYGMFAKYREAYKKYHDQRAGLDKRYAGLPSVVNTGVDTIWRKEQEEAIQKRVNEGPATSRKDLLQEVESDLRGPRKGYFSGMSIATNLGGYGAPKYDRVTVPTERGNVTFTVPHDKYPETKKPNLTPIYYEEPRSFKNLWGLFNRTRIEKLRPKTDLSSDKRITQPTQTSSNWFTRWWYGL